MKKDKERINELIETKRSELNELSLSEPLSSKIVLKRSRQLDRLLNFLNSSKKEQTSA